MLASGNRQSANSKRLIFVKGSEVAKVEIKETLADVNASVTKHLVIVAQDEAKVAVNAKIVIEPEATNAKVLLKIEVLVVDGSPQVAVLPYLEVKNSTAEARHSVSTIRLGEEALFYAKARGLHETSIKDVLLNSVVERFIAR